MAAGQIQRRFFSFFMATVKSTALHTPSFTVAAESSWHNCRPIANSLFHRDDFLRRFQTNSEAAKDAAEDGEGFQTHAEAGKQHGGDVEGFQTCGDAQKQAVKSMQGDQGCSLKSVADSAKVVPSQISEETSLQLRVKSELKISSRHDLAMIFTCKVCETRSFKTVCRESYEKGVVVARCNGCNNLHLIADRLGWFGEPSSVEDFLAGRGEEVTKGSIDTLNLTFEDLAGKKNAEQL